ncbi:MAG TPA: nuclease, partial [Halomonas sp.]|nr:nuclease [Halomonas sp.]
EFVLTELGLQRFEQVPLTAESRAFQRREEVDTYLTLHRLRERLESGEPPDRLAADVPAASGNRWLDARRSRLLLTLGQTAERSGEAEQALLLYAESTNSEARIRRLRVLERLKRYSEAYELAQAAREQARESETQALGRLLPRLARKLNQPAPQVVKAAEAPTYVLELPGPQSVERAVAEHLSTASTP